MTDLVDSELELSEIPIELFDKRANKTTNLINNTDPKNEIKARYTWYTFGFIEPLFVSELEIHTEGHTAYSKAEINITLIDDTQKTVNATNQDNSFTFQANYFVKGFSIKVDTGITTKYIKSVRVIGYKQTSFRKLEAAISTIDQDRAEVQADKDKQNELEEQIKQLGANKAALAADVEKLEANEVKASTKTEVAEQSLREKSETLKDREAEIATAQSSLRKLRSEIEDSKAELTRVTQELRVFPSDLTGFVQEGGRNIRNYLLMSVPFTVVIVAIAYTLLSGAVELSHLVNLEESTVDVMTVFLTRLPFVLVALTLLEVCGYIVGRFVFEIVKINRQRLAMQKLSIVAKDVSAASSIDTDLSNDEIFAHETALKMELLREYMKEDIGEEFQYQGTALQSAVKSVASRISGKSE